MDELIGSLEEVSFEIEERRDELSFARTIPQVAAADKLQAALVILDAATDRVREAGEILKAVE